MTCEVEGCASRNLAPIPCMSSMHRICARVGGVDSIRAELTSLKLRGEQASDRAGVPFSARIVPSEKFWAVAVAEVDPPKGVAAGHGSKPRRSRYQLTIFIAQRPAYRVGGAIQVR